VVLDARMPGMTGLDVQRRLISSHPDLPVIFMTAHDDAQTRSQALSDGAVGYLIKPSVRKRSWTRSRRRSARHDRERRGHASSRVRRG